jgi:hypothetical protein
MNKIASACAFIPLTFVKLHRSEHKLTSRRTVCIVRRHEYAKLFVSILIAMGESARPTSLVFPLRMQYVRGLLCRTRTKGWRKSPHLSRKIFRLPRHWLTSPFSDAISTCKAACTVMPMPYATPHVAVRGDPSAVPHTWTTELLHYGSIPRWSLNSQGLCISFSIRRAPRIIPSRT